MIHLYTGKTGSGKTYKMVQDVYKRWYYGHDIYSNTLLFFEKYGGKADTNIIENPENFTLFEKYFVMLWRKLISKLFKKELRPVKRGKIIYFDDITELIELRNGVICMDEAQHLLDARNWETLPLEFSNKLRQHRKHNLDLYATTQNMGTIDINMRRLVQKWIHSKDVFALFWKKNPSLFSIHKYEEKDIDELYNKVDDLIVTTKSYTYGFIHIFKKRKYDTLFDIGFKAYKMVWIQQNKQKKLIIMPIHWTLNNARTQLLLAKYYLDLNKSNRLKKI